MAPLRFSRCTNCNYRGVGRYEVSEWDMCCPVCDYGLLEITEEEWHRTEILLRQFERITPERITPEPENLVLRKFDLDIPKPQPSCWITFDNIKYFESEYDPSEDNWDDDDDDDEEEDY